MDHSETCWGVSLPEVEKYCALFLGCLRQQTNGRDVRRTDSEGAIPEYTYSVPVWKEGERPNEVVLLLSVVTDSGSCEQLVRVVDHRTKYEECKKIVDALHTDARVIVFCNRKHDVRHVEEQLWNSGAKVGCPLLPQPSPPQRPT
jgi:hypothetical protein